MLYRLLVASGVLCLRSMAPLIQYAKHVHSVDNRLVNRDIFQLVRVSCAIQCPIRCGSSGCISSTSPWLPEQADLLNQAVDTGEWYDMSKHGASIRTNLRPVIGCLDVPMYRLFDFTEGSRNFKRSNLVFLPCLPIWTWGPRNLWRQFGRQYYQDDPVFFDFW